MSELLGFGHGELWHAVVDEVLRDRAFDCRRLHQETRRNVEIAVILHHSRVSNIGEPLPVELVEEIALRTWRARTRSPDLRES